MELIGQMQKNAEETGQISQNPSDRRKEQDSYHKMLSAHGIHRRFWDCTFESMEQSEIPEQCRRNFIHARDYANRFAEYKSKGIGILMMGPVGVIKTSLSVAIAQAVLKQKYSVQFIPMAELLDQILTMTRKKDPSEFLQFEERLRSTSLLIIDDLGAEYKQNWITNKVDAIITARYNRMLPMIVTTNLKPDELLGRYQERVYDRLKGASLVMKYEGDSLRTAPIPK
jgi:DNA replication protein DnaC